ncbi:MAG TPA: IS110 family transposase [Burkholderiales bacterium]|nr:IS110 family transposase [Burkholderiales bacterium]
MEKGTTYVALDDSKRKIVAGILRAGDTEPVLREIPNEPTLIRRLFSRLKREAPVSACYEAGVSGYDLYRQLTALGVACQVMAPALTPRRPGQRIKTDRRDAGKLVRLFRAGELTPIHVPDEAEEAVRDLVRCRDDVRRDVLRWRHRLLKLLARHGRVYLAGKHWTHPHWQWIRAQHFDLPALQRAFEATLFALEQALTRLAELDHELTAIAQRAPYQEPVGWLRCFRGIDTLSAMILLAEIVDFQRFHRPRQLMAYLGLVPSEYSSGDTQRRGTLTKAGNTHVRRALIEAAWHYRHRPMLSPALRARSQGQPPEVLTQAWRAQQRLHRRYRHLINHGKRPPVVVAAVARELVGFLWATMTRPRSAVRVA